MEAVNICFVCDEKYVKTTVVAIYSIKESININSKYNIYILADNITQESKKIIKNLESDRFLIFILDIENKDFLKLKIENIHVSKAALSKFYIANIFKNLNKILYLDSDIIVKGDLKNIFDIDIHNVYAAVVKDYKVMRYPTPQTVKLKVNHKAYFNTGVMLLNLNKMRDDKIEEALIDYRIHGINFFMDQDAFNVVFQENVKYIPFFNNMILSVIGYFDVNELIKYYELQEVESLEDIIDKALILHLASPYKPWDYDNIPFSKEWRTLYKKCFNNELTLKSLDNQLFNKTFPYFKVARKPIFWNIELPVIVSLTTTPKRIKNVTNVIKSMQNQTVKVDKIILVLGNNLFPNKELDLPKEIIELIGRNFEIMWNEDLGPHTKYFYTMKKYPESIVITVDDDIYYPSTLVEELLISYCKYPYAISARRAHLIKFDYEGELCLYNNWKFNCTNVRVPSILLFATGVGGVLYPPHSMHKELFNVEAIKNLCFKADDLWLKFMQLLNNTPVVLATTTCKLKFIENTQEFGLCHENVDDGLNDKQLSLLIKKYNNAFGRRDTLLKRLEFSFNNQNMISNKSVMSSGKTFNDTNNYIYTQTKKELIDIKNSKAYKIGKTIVWLPKKIRGGIHCYKEHGLKYTLWRIKQKALNLFK